MTEPIENIMVRLIEVVWMVVTGLAVAISAFTWLSISQIDNFDLQQCYIDVAWQSVGALVALLAVGFAWRFVKRKFKKPEV